MEGINHYLDNDNENIQFEKAKINVSIIWGACQHTHLKERTSPSLKYISTESLWALRTIQFSPLSFFSEDDPLLLVQAVSIIPKIKIKIKFFIFFFYGGK